MTVFHGRIGQMDDQGFRLQYVSGGKIEERTVSFMDVKSIGRYYPATRTQLIFALIAAAVPLGMAIGFAAAR